MSTTTTTTLRGPLTEHYSRGDARIKLALDADDGSLIPLLCFTDHDTGRTVVVDLLADECAELARDLLTLCNADRAQVETWTLTLAYEG